MRILFIVPYTPNLIRVRSYNLIRHLTLRGHEVIVLTLSSGSNDEADAKALSKYCHQVIQLPISRWRSAWNCLTVLPSAEPLQSAYSWQPRLAKKLTLMIDGQENHRPLDVIHVEHMRGVRYGLHARKTINSNRSSLPVVWDSVDCISSLFRQASSQSTSIFGRWITRFELGRTERYEGWLLSQYNQVLVTAASDRKALLELVSPGFTSAQVNVLPLGVDLDYFKPISTGSRKPSTLIVSGKMSYHANVTMVLYLVEVIMPLVWAHRSDVKLVVVGKDPSLSIRKLDQHPLISVLGTVADMRPYLQSATIAVAPLRYNVGTQFKILEAMASGTPVITTPQAAEPLRAVPGRDLLVAEDDTSFANNILALLPDTSRQRELGANGRAYVEAHHQWAEITRQLEGIYQRSIHDKS